MLLVLGNACMDRVLHVDRLPQDGESVLARAGDRQPGGKGLNQAVTARRCGAAVRFLTVVGQDAAGDDLAHWLGREGLGGEVLRWNGATDESVILVSPAGANMVVTTDAASAAMPEGACRDAIAGLTLGDHLLMQGNFDVGLTRRALLHARARGVVTLLNPSPFRAAITGAAAVADILILNEGEAAALQDVAAPLRIVSLGARGAEIWRDGAVTRVPAPAVTVVDTTGAGDVLAGVLAGRLVLGDAPEAALVRAVQAASAKVGRAGTGAALPTAADLATLAV